VFQPEQPHYFESPGAAETLRQFDNGGSANGVTRLAYTSHGMERYRMGEATVVA
jgi:hypothetical protein